MNSNLPRPDPLTSLPVVILMLKSGCNCRCSMCDIWLDKTNRELPLAEIRDLLPQLRDLATGEIVLSGGEPLMHSRIEEICREIKSGDYRLTLLTTGLLLRRHAAWIGTSADRIYISLDGPEEIHNQIRNIPDAFAKIARGIEAVRRANPAISIGGRCTVQRRNYRHLSATVHAARGLGMDSISFLGADLKPGTFGRAAGWRDRDLALAATDLAELRGILDHLYSAHAEDFASAYIVEDPARLEQKLYGYYRAQAGSGSFPAVHCNAPWVSTVVELDGSVRPCFFHPAYPGNLGRQPLTAIVNAGAARNWRQALDVGNDPVCETCVCTLALKTGAR